MAWIVNSTYTFKINDTDYINALASLVGHLTINETSRFPELFKGKKIKDLSQFLILITPLSECQKSPADLELTLTTQYQITSSLKSVLPVFLSHASSTDPIVLDAAEAIGWRIAYQTYNEEEVALSNTKLEALTQEQAMEALNVAYKKAPFRSAIALPSESAIMVLTMCGQTLELCYGENRSSLGYGPEIGFDVDDGFWGDKNEPIPKELKDAAEKWIAGGRKGPVFESAMDAPADRARARAERYKAHAAPNRVGAAAFAGVIGLLYLAGGLGWPAMLLLGGAAFLCAHTISSRQAQIVSGVTREFCETKKYKNLSADEYDAFRAGVIANRSNRDVLNAWKNNQTYIHYDVYVAGRTLAENNAPKVKKVLGQY